MQPPRLGSTFGKSLRKIDAAVPPDVEAHSRDAGTVDFSGLLADQAMDVSERRSRPR
jgi:hypothetical protein